MKNVHQLSGLTVWLVLFLSSFNQIFGAVATVQPEFNTNSCKIQISSSSSTLCTGNTAVLSVDFSGTSISCTQVNFKWQVCFDQSNNWETQGQGESFEYIGAVSGPIKFRAIVDSCFTCSGTNTVVSNVVTVIFRAIPVFTIDGPREVCLGGISSLKVSESYPSYIWNTNENSSPTSS